jgi:chemotaxis response regulator CheB
VQGPHAAGAILSGTGSDGTLGIGEIKAVGGLTFAQDDASAQYPDMPRNAVASVTHSARTADISGARPAVTGTKVYAARSNDCT